MNYSHFLELEPYIIVRSGNKIERLAALFFPEFAHEVGAVGAAGLFENVMGVGLHGAESEMQIAGDILVVLAFQHQSQDVALTRGQAMHRAISGNQLVDVLAANVRVAHQGLVEA